MPHADDDADVNRRYEGGRTSGALIEAACWVPPRGKIVDGHAKTGPAIAGEALERIGALHAVEHESADSLSIGDTDSDGIDLDRRAMPREPRRQR